MQNQTIKSSLRATYRKIKLNELSLKNNNRYHSGLLENLLTVIRKHTLSPCSPNDLLIGSYIPKPCKQIIPPFLQSHNLIPFSLQPTKSPLSVPFNPSIKITYCYPIFNKNSRNMVFYQHYQGCPYKIGDFGIKVKDTELGVTMDDKNVNWTMDYVLVPLVCFSRTGNRIGEGGGYYDLFIRRYRQSMSKDKHSQQKSNKFSLFIGIGLQKLKLTEQQQKFKIFNQHDQKLDAIITETNIYQGII